MPPAVTNATLEYSQLRRVAQWLMSKERRTATLTATALVHELFVKLSRHKPATSQEMPVRTAGFAARVMRQILIDRARSRQSRCRAEDGHSDHVESRAPDRGTGDLALADDLLDLSAALDQLDERSPELSELVRLKIFAGLSVEDAAANMNMPRATAYRKWEFAKAWLAMKMGDRGVEQPDAD